MEQYKIQALVIYPIKGMMGIHVNEAKAYEHGFEHDRNWMLVDENGRFISQRTFPELTQFKLEIIKEDLVIKYGASRLIFRLNEVSNNEIEVSVWDHHGLKAKEVSHQVSQWFSQKLKTSCRLVKMTNQTSRLKLLPSNETTKLSFADGYPYLILGTSSVSFLNEQLPLQINANRFRANILIETQEAHEEDEWSAIEIGKGRFEMVKPCARCVVPTIHQETGIKQPIVNKVLSEYRLSDKKIYFGMNAVVRDPVKISMDQNAHILK